MAKSKLEQCMDLFRQNPDQTAGYVSDMLGCSKGLAYTAKKKLAAETTDEVEDDNEVEDDDEVEDDTIEEVRELTVEPVYDDVPPVTQDDFTNPVKVKQLKTSVRIACCSQNGDEDGLLENIQDILAIGVDRVRKILQIIDTVENSNT